MTSSKTEAAKTEQIITEFFAKSLHIILESRALSASSRNFSTLSSPSSTSSSSSSSVRPRDKWFNLALRECPTALENADLWRHNNLEPIVVDVVLVQRNRTLQLDQNLCFSPRTTKVRSFLEKQQPFEELGIGVSQNEKIVERWVIQYENKKIRDCSSSNSSRRSSNTLLQNLYKKSILLLRSLYSTVRILPAYKIFREINSSGNVCAFTLAHRVSTFFEPFTTKQESEMLKFVFTPVDTYSGRLCLSVMYRPCFSDVSSEPSTPLSPQVITDYVGSPMTDRLMRFPSLPVVRLPLHGSPSSLPFSRRHSWSYENCRASSPSINNYYYSTSPTHSDSHTLVSNVSSQCYPPSSLPPHPSEMSLYHKKNVNFDDYYPSPNFSLSPSPSSSSPIYNLGSLASKTLLRSESAPVNIPNAEVANSLGHSGRHNLPPSTPIRISRCISETDRSRNLMQSSTAEKLFSLGKDESQKYSGVKIAPNSSPQVSFSRSSSRSYQDDFDDTDFTCPFDVDDDDTTDPGSRVESFDHGHMTQLLESGRFLPIRKSQGAAVGALVHMLKKAAPLHQDFSTSENLSRDSTRPETWKSNNVQEPNQILATPTPVSIMSSGNKKTTSDALEEFHSYREMKNMLLMPRGGSK